MKRVSQLKSYPYRINFYDDGVLGISDDIESQNSGVRWEILINAEDVRKAIDMWCSINESNSSD